MIIKDKASLEQRMTKLHISDTDLIEKFIMGSGSGGQKINKTSSCVYLKHIPTGIEIKCQQTRSRERNRFLALEELCNRLEKKLADHLLKEKQAKEKIRRQKRKRTKGGQEKVLENKRRRSQVKTMRQKKSNNE